MSYTVPTTSLRPKARPLTESLRPKSRPSERGLAAREEPEQPQQENEETSFWDFFDFFGGSTSEDDNTPPSERASRLYEEDAFSTALAERPGITENPFEYFLGPNEPSEPEVFIAEPSPVTTPAETEAPTGAGLMSPPIPQEGTVEEAPVEVEETDQTEVSTSFATIVSGDSSTSVTETPSLTAGFDSLVEAEGTSIHLDGRGFLTLPYGIVPDADSVKKADGTAFDPRGSHGLKTSNLSGVNYSSATKFGISRTSYETDEAFAKAVYSEFANRTSTSYGEGFDGLTDEAKQAAYDMAWNAGIGSAAWSSVQTMLKEASKEGDKSKESLIGFTTNFRSGSDYPRGLLKRRLQTYNLVANEGEESSTITTTASKTDGVRTGTTYTIKSADGTTLKTWTKPDTDEKLGDLSVE